MSWHYILLFYFGTFLGSFFYTLALRYASGSIKENPVRALFSRSHCPVCASAINPFLLFPIIGYIIARGKCRKCGAAISSAYPVFEALYGLLLIAVVMSRGISIYTAFMYLALAVVFTIAIIDFKTQTIPNSLVVVLLALCVYPVLFHGEYKSNLYGFLLMAGLFLLILLIFPGSFGGGDLKLAAVLGLLSGLDFSVVVIEAALISGTIIGVIYAIIKKKGLKTQIPFAPFLFFGLLVSFFYGSEIILLYSSLLWK